jgi:RNA polymerase sigma factor (sigma-70 family)
MGTIGIARAAYRYHPAVKIRFSTYAAQWVYSEIRRQTHRESLIRRGQVVENGQPLDSSTLEKGYALIGSAELAKGPQQWQRSDSSPPLSAVEAGVEHAQFAGLLAVVLDRMPRKQADIIKRRYGLAPYNERSQSVMEIAESLGVTRSAVYQQEKKALATLRKKLTSHLVLKIPR